MAARTQASPRRRSSSQSSRRAPQAGYIHGTAAPKLSPQAAPRPERPQGKPMDRQAVRNRHRIHRNQERALHMDLPYVIVLTIASVFTLCLCINYLHVQSSITARMHNIDTMEARLEQLKAANDDLETSINTSVDLNKIYDIATKELGMVYAKKDQVLMYDKTEREYVRQNEDIPKN